MVRSKSNGFASSLHARELVDSFAADRPNIPQERFLDIELADDLRHDYLDSMDAETRNKILFANEKVIKSLLKVATCFGQMLSVENIEGCLASVYEKNLKADLAHTQAGLLKSMALAVIRETKKSKNARKDWMKRLKDACGDVLLKKKFERDNSGTSLEGVQEEEAAPAALPAGLKGTIPDGPPPSCLGAVLGAIHLHPPWLDYRLQQKKHFKEVVLNLRKPGAADETLGPSEEPMVAPAPGPEGVPLASSAASESDGAAGQWSIGEGGVLCSAPLPPGDDEEPVDPPPMASADGQLPPQEDPEEEQHGNEQDGEEAATQQQPPKRTYNQHNGPVYTVYMAFLEKARSKGIKHMEAVRLWRHSTIRAVLMESIPEDERKRRRYN